MYSEILTLDQWYLLLQTIQFVWRFSEENFET